MSAAFTNRSTVPVDLTEMTLLAAAGGPDWRLPSNDAGRTRLGANQTARHTFAAATLPTARLSRPYFERGSIAEARYTVGDASQLFKPASTPSLRARVAEATVQASILQPCNDPCRAEGPETRAA